MMIFEFARFLFFLKKNRLKFSEKVIESFDLRKKSKHLLECAKRAVEIAIEQDEQKAIDWLEDKLDQMTTEKNKTLKYE